MPAFINFGYMEVLDVTSSDVNFGLAITAAPITHAKRNSGYGNNVGDFKYTPSWTMLIDNDLIDNPRYTPTFAPVGTAGV